ncbi:PEST proteolytic signal-containing nuclear protein-like isoform X2 [Phlebotomus argentipes]|uniref:PEST proteolytic signal-containing nuclear protein-like isoform X2 n=1 Tax=Phlebotomus argentipes TaxID=94469 RepID=UPI002892A919|nr:PEST proteolytic signal-containing nuclear protein-like isoform X2 [Phlebotomus argentipes]
MPTFDSCSHYPGSGGSGGRRRSRSRSPERRRYSSDEEEDHRHTSGYRSELRRQDERERRRKRERSPEPENESKSVLPPPPPRISKVSMSFGKPGAAPKAIQMKLNPTGRSESGKLTVASAFNADSDDEVEEMPPECRMKMRNIGRDTPTSSGPNSFGKTKQGFCDSKKIFEKTLRGSTNTDDE